MVLAVTLEHPLRSGRRDFEVVSHLHNVVGFEFFGKRLDLAVWIDLAVFFKFRQFKPVFFSKRQPQPVIFRKCEPVSFRLDLTIFFEFRLPKSEF
jgi:hypothetical protein